MGSDIGKSLITYVSEPVTFSSYIHGVPKYERKIKWYTHFITTDTKLIELYTKILFLNF